MGTNDVYLDDKAMPVGGTVGSRAMELREKERIRVREVKARRHYYNGTQFDARNAERAKLAKATTVADLPEHEKLHAYSTQIQESVDFIAAQMTESFQLKASATVQPILMKALQRSPDLKSGYDASNVSLTNVLRDALIAHDAPARIRWDAVEETAWPEFWDSEQVQFIYADRNRHDLERVVVRQAVWVTGLSGDEVKRIERREWSLDFMGECVIDVYWDDEEEPTGLREHLRIPFIPWVTVRVSSKDRHAVRGDSAITDQAMRAADRYNAVEQLSFLIARYNSHGNLAVIGDGATLKAQMEEHINKDVADILTFPGGTALQVLTLPTDPQMIEHQRSVLLDTLYGTFGLTRTDQQSLADMGQVTGYALEILNRKSDGTFNQLRNQFVGDFKSLLDMILDMTAYMEAMDAPDDSLPVELSLSLEDGIDTALAMDEIDPADVFSDRKYEIELGSGYVVDEALTRDDYTAGLISRREVLRQRGYSKEKIDEIFKELEDEKPDQPETGVSAEAAAAAKEKIAAATLKAGSIVNNGKTPDRSASGK